MSKTIVGILGFLTIIAIVYMLFQSKTLPSIAFITFPSILAIILVIGGYYTIADIAASLLQADLRARVQPLRSSSSAFCISGVISRS